jgi:hypothetical protein
LVLIQLGAQYRNLGEDSGHSHLRPSCGALPDRPVRRGS